MPACPKDHWCKGGVSQPTPCGTCSECKQTQRRSAQQGLMPVACRMPMQHRCWQPCNLQPLQGVLLYLHTEPPSVLCCSTMHAAMTKATLAQDASACITRPGCGFSQDGTAAACRIGTFSSGNHQQPCTPCPSGLTTTSISAVSISACMAPPGFFFQVCVRRLLLLHAWTSSA